MTHRKREEYGFVDKPNKGNTIKIKLNAENPPIQEVPPKEEVETNIDPVPRIIKINTELTESDVTSETAAAQESVDESFDWIIPESSDNEIEEFKIIPSQTSKKTSLPKITTFTSNIKKKNSRPLGSILISAAFAILIGTTIGIVMLKLVITSPSDKTVTTVPTEVTDKPASSTETKTAEAKNTSAASISQLTTYVIQGGVFSSDSGAKETSDNLSAKNVPSETVEMDGKYYLFLGVADSIEGAKALGAQYKENGIEDVFAKPLLLEEKKFSNITDKEKTFLKAVPTIYQTLSLTTSNAVVTKDLSEEASKVLKDIESPLKTSVKNEKIKDLKAELVSANEKVNAFQESKDEKNLRDAQEHLLNFLSIYFSN
ncbi:SPOR domain-containing protein [Bacillus sp. X1(2014)]|uniref:SPOR domain-containing protein n=1 Tax=Bacillus sp. X1(2014) TaxID=1565991 RepID=UPI0011A5740C|nr:SPOR domain-containing protein [Bacillus sp. X1(2014)]